MAAPKYLIDILISAKTEVQIIRDFAVSADKALQERKPEIPPGQRDPTHAEDLKKVRDLLDLLDGTPDGKGRKKTKISISGSAGAWILQALYPIKQQNFLAEMTLSYLASHLEAFLKDYVLAILVRNPMLLKSNSSLTFEEVCAFSSMKNLRRELAERQVDALGRGSIDDSAQYFEKKFSVQFSRFESWPQLRESIYRRNLIVHNRARVNALYVSKTGYSGKKKKLETDMEYVSNAAGEILAFMQFVHDSTGVKFGPKRNGEKA